MDFCSDFEFLIKEKKHSTRREFHQTKMARSISGIKKFPGLSKCPKGPPVTKFGFTRKSPRCAQCLKFQADDPSKIGEDEFEKLLRCSNCKRVYYCSKICAEKNFSFHKLYCEDRNIYGNFGLKYAENSPPTLLFAPAVMGEDAKLCEEFLKFAANQTFFSNTATAFAKGSFAERDRLINDGKQKCLQPSSNALCNVILLFLGRDQEAYEFLKYSVLNFEKEANYELFKGMPKKYGNPNSCKEKFFAMDFFKRLLITTQKSMQSPLLLVPYWLTLAIIKINVIEEMKANFNEMEVYFRLNGDLRKKFKNSPNILEGLAILHLGNDDTIGCSRVYCNEESFLMELNDQKQQLKKLLNLMVKNFQGRQEIAAIWLAIEGDCREHFISNYQKELVYQFIAGQEIFALVKYFNRHPTASKIILDSMEKNKTGDKVEKNFYINLMELTQKPHYLHIHESIGLIMEVINMRK